MYKICSVSTQYAFGEPQISLLNAISQKLLLNLAYPSHAYVLCLSFCHGRIVTKFSSRLKNKNKQRKINLLLKLKKLTSWLLKNLEQNKWLLNLETFTSHCLKNPEILLVLLIGPLLIRPDCVYV